MTRPAKLAIVLRRDFVSDRHVARHRDDSDQFWPWRPESTGADERRHDLDVRGRAPNEHPVLCATIRPPHPWLTMETTGSTVLSPGNSPATEISTHGEFNSRRGCRGAFGSVGTAEATRIEADFTGTDCQLAAFTGRVALTKG